MGSATITDKTSGNSATISYPDDATPEAISANVDKVKGMLRQGAAGGSAVGAALAQNPAKPSSMRTAAGIAGGALGGLAGLRRGPMGALHGAVTGSGIAGAADDYLEGRGDWRRDLLTAAGPTVAGPYTKGMGLAARMLGAGGATALIGQADDLATGKLLGKNLIGQDVSRETLGDATGAAVGDFGAGGLGQGMGEAGAELQGPATRRPGGISAQEQADREAFSAAEDIPLSASGRTGRKSVARTEQLPGRVPVGSDVSQGFYDQQLAATEKSIDKRLQRLDVIAESRNPTVAGETTQAELPKLAAEVDRASAQAFGAVKKAFRPGVSSDVVPAKFVAKAEEIMAQGRGAPYPTPGNAAGMVRAHSTTAPIPVLYSASGQPITLQQLAAQPEPMTYDQARFYLKQMGARTFKSGQPVIGDVDDGIRKQLWGALNDDISDMMTNHPEAHELYRWAKRGYGQTKELVVNRLQKVVGKLEPEKVAPAIFKPRALKRTMQMKQILPRDRFDELAGALANTWIQKAQTATSSGHVEMSTAKLATEIKPYAESGQLDVMFPQDVADYFRQFLQFEPALQSTNRLAGNPSGTGQTLLSSQQASGLMAPLKYPTDPNSYKTALGALAPGPLARFMFSPSGINAMTRLGNEGPGAMASGAAASSPALATLVQRGVQSPFMRWLQQQ